MDDRLSRAISRDDLDRLLVAVGLVVVWFFPWSLAATGQAAEYSSALTLLFVVAGPPLLLVLAAFLMWRDVAALRLPLTIVALVDAAVLALLAPTAGPLILFAVAGALAVAVGAWRMRVPAQRGILVRRRAVPDAEVARPETLQTFIARASRLSPEETRALHAAWRAINPAAREQAWTAVRREVAAARRGGLLEDLRREIELWGRAAGGSPWTWEFGTMVDVDRSNLRRAAMPALLDAAAAILVGDRLSERDREALIGPWEAVAEAEPTDPEAAEAGAPD